MKRIFAFTLAVFLPFAATAEACPHGQQVSSCADGFVWNEDSKTCVKQVLG